MDRGGGTVRLLHPRAVGDIELCTRAWLRVDPALSEVVR
jgi:hypothetical protein